MYEIVLSRAIVLTWQRAERPMTSHSVIICLLIDEHILGRPVLINYTVNHEKGGSAFLNITKKNLDRVL